MFKHLLSPVITIALANGVFFFHVGEVENTGQKMLSSADNVPIDSIAEAAECDERQPFELMR
jgi:hypothetical protein